MVEIADGLRPEQRIDGNEPLVAVIKNLFASGLATKARVTSRTIDMYLARRGSF